ncbi:hypothetical protein [Phocoenobacter skyensis]|uniref:Uncharacterized protein n=1 Tax=Phocoenobacter skyensis TaxID=97481 RepID=A0ABT9JIA2_9PAST|nr:hypothetical protein [Pasteurella skyensis]MDP8078361.1 hypothetical protein [Pasteurella skyensis]MDP8084547.1 hypothetical protein [Pasteurella skyensis]
MAETNIYDFMNELDAGIFERKVATALSDVALGVVTHDKVGKVTLEFSVKKMDSDNPQVQISHKLTYAKPTKRGKSSEEDTTATPMYVHKGGKLSVTPEKIDNTYFKRDEEQPTITLSVN